jgi:hypothetical protein
MKKILAILTLVSILSAFTGQALAGELKIDLKIEGQPTVEIVLKIEGDMATAKVGDEAEQFNLKDQSWLDPKSGKWTTLTECKEWAEQSKAKTRSFADAAPEYLRAYFLWSIDPKFEVKKDMDTLRLTSGQVDYEIAGQSSKADVDAYYRYAVLNAYKKAMTERRVPPYAELKAVSEMKKLGHIPRRIVVTVPGIPDAPKIEMEFSETKP